MSYKLSYKLNKRLTSSLYSSAETESPIVSVDVKLNVIQENRMFRIALEVT